MLAYHAALDRLLHAAHALPALTTETVPLLQALGRISATAVCSSVQVPRFDNSQMDGYAVRSSATQAAPLRLPLHAASVVAGGEAFAGDASAVAIMTGAPMPPGFDAVLKVEDTTHDGAAIIVDTPVTPGTFVRPAGEDFAVGAELVAAGERLTAAQLMALSSCGVAQVEVLAPLRVALIVTGRELAEPGAPLGSPSMIWSSSKVYLEAMLGRPGIALRTFPIVPDDTALFRAQVASALDWGATLIVTTGAVSAGVHDFVPGELTALGAEALFHKVAIRPGKPVFAATLGSALCLGLPGNPVSTAVGHRFFVEPCVRALRGERQSEEERAVLRHDVTRPRELRCFFKARRAFSAQGVAEVTVLEGQGSHLVRPMLGANVWAVLSEGSASREGDVIGVVPFD